MTIDVKKTIEARGSRLKLVLLGILGIAMTAGCAWVAWAGLASAGSFAQLAIWIGVPFFGMCTLIGLRRLFTAERVVLMLSPQGIRDTRVAAEIIPWTAVRGLGTWAMQGQKVLVLDVDPEVEKRLTLTRMARWTRGANAKLGADGLCISASGLDIGYGALFDAASAHVEATHRQ